MRPSKPSSLISRAKTAAFIVSDLTNIRYLTGLNLTAGLILVTRKGMTLFVDGRYTEVARAEVRHGIAVSEFNSTTNIFKGITRCGYEAEEVTVSRLERWKKKSMNTKFVQTVGIIEEFRRAKDAEELRHFRKAQRITQRVLRELPAVLHGSLTEKQLAEWIRHRAVELGADSLSFDPTVAFGTHTSRPHHKPTSRKLRKRDIIQIDCGARVNGYCADQSRVYFRGKSTAQQQRVFNAVSRAKKAATKAVRAGVSNREPDRIARDVLKKENLEQYFVHSLGHGVGLEIHEGSTLSQKAKKVTLLKNEIVTIEPGVYIPGKFGIRLEDEVVVG